MQTATITHSFKSRPLTRAAALLFFFVAGCFLFLLAMQLTSKVEPEQLVIYSGYGILLSFLAYSSFAYRRGRAIVDAAPTFAVLRVVWLFLLIDDIIFNFGRHNPLSNELQGKFTSAAYGEVILWMVSAVILTVVSLPQLKEVLGTFFTGAFKWMTLFLFLCVASAVYSVSPGYSLAWSFKLGLDVLMVVLMYVCVRGESGIRSVLRTTALSISIVLMMALIQIGVDPENAFAEGRLGGIAHPTVLSELGGLLLLISLVIYTLEKAKWSLPAALLASVVMMLGGGKISIVAAAISVGIFFLLQKKAGSGALAIAGLGILGVVILLVSPTGGYFAKYAASDQAGTLTGRSALWQAQLPEIKQKIVLGHGYLASKFVPAPFKQGDWQVGSLHNAYLDVLYNLGLVGLFVLLMMNLWIVRNLFYVRKHTGDPAVFAIACGMLAIYLDLLVNSPFAVPFGGRPYAFFMVFLALLGLSIKLRESMTVLEAERAA
jgi:O-antigen ligase